MKRLFFLLSLVVGLGGCLSVKTEPIEVKPIHITVDVNLRVEREVAGLLSDIYGNSTTIAATK